jgi:hypothetical protein
LKRDAIEILQRAYVDVIFGDEGGSRDRARSLRNAFEYLLYGQISGPRGVANMWANWPVGE